ncbi:MAG: FAD-dependent oxidoreductase, partial [Chloroflexota bacterium]
VGAGLSGLVAAHQLLDAGKSVIVVDKGRSVGGRLATRRIQNGRADHGAQFFTVRTDAFQSQVDKWLAKDLVYVWGRGWSDGSLQKNKPDGYPRYATRQGMNYLARDLAENVPDIRVSTRIASIQWQDDSWQLTDTDGQSLSSDVLIMTAPVPQTLVLLENVPLTEEDRTALQKIDYGPCLCGLFVVEGEVNLPEPGARQNFEDTVYWIADNKAKGISPDERIITLHADADFSRTNYDAPPEENLAVFRAELEKYLADGASITEEQLKKWRYSIPQTMHPDDVLQASNLPLICAGDAFGGRARVEGAFLSGLEAGKRAIAL